MATVGSSVIGSSGGSGGLQPATTPTITNLSVPTANTEVSHALVANVKQILVSNRDNGLLKAAFTVTESGTKYFTIWPGQTRCFDSLNYSGTLYMQSTSASQTVEIVEWS
jgi:hypothetical protein